MPHDSKGRELKAGDRVIFEAMVRDVYPNESACNATFEIPGIDRDGVKEYPAVVTCNTRMCEKVETIPSPVLPS